MERSKTSLTFRSGAFCYCVIDPVRCLVEVSYEDKSGYRDLTELTIPSSVTYEGTVYTVVRIGIWAFAWRCSQLVSIVMPDSITCIDDRAFFQCSSLTTLYIPENVVRIGEDICYGCNSLHTIEVAPGNPHYDSREGCNAIIETATNTLIAGCHTTRIPHSVTILGNGAFGGCDTLTTIDLPDSIVQVGEEVCMGCDGLQTLCIPEHVTSIGMDAFGCCKNLKTVYVKAPIPPELDWYTFEELAPSPVLYVPAHSLDAYRETSWKWIFRTILPME